MKTFPTGEGLKRLPFGLADVVVILGTIVLLSFIARIRAEALVSFRPPWCQVLISIPVICPIMRVDLP